MYSINIHPDNITRQDTSRKMNYFETSSYLFIGPFQAEEGDGCFSCFYHLLESNESDLKQRIDFESKERHGLHVFEAFLTNLNKEDFINQILIIDKKNLNLEWKKIRKTPFCRLCHAYVLEQEENELLFNHPDGTYRVKNKKAITQTITSFIDELIDRDIGVGLRLFRDAESNIIPMYAIESRINSRIFYSYGRTEQLSDAKNAAILEMLERYSSMVPQFKQPIFYSYDRLIAQNFAVIPPEKYILRHPFDKQQEIFWSETKLYPSQETWLIPEQMMYFDNQLLRNENRFIYETSNGTAMGGSIEEALVYAVLEAIERDSFLVHWYLRKLPQIIDPISIKDKNVIQLMTTIEQLGYDIYLFDITLETRIPTVWIFMRNKKEDASLYLYSAAGSHYDPEKAIFAALVEVGTSVIVYEEKLSQEKEGLKYLINNPSEVTQMEDHVNYYAFKENGEAFDYLLSHIDQLGKTTVEKMRPDFPFTFENILKKVTQHHPEIYYTDMSNSLIDEMGLSVVKVFIPSLQPMTFGKQNERINEERLKRVAGKSSVMVGKEPHPFP
ncbi:YcaO-like family protein [Sporosarcina sp. 6E9]|uniref:YcaO-like family protein n=1 Tax=Sporosarcina sp. 6E9 TaxID=2819235 RepID=UPI001B303751|nr:YcaO-like family protein [Sporosarcina sp. 6E9]